jgi:hypothetical protein
MQIAPTIVMLASFAPIERFANKLRIFDIKPPPSAQRRTQKSGAQRSMVPSPKLEQNR